MTKKEQLEQKLTAAYKKHEAAKLLTQKRGHMDEINGLLDEWNKETKNESKRDKKTPAVAAERGPDLHNAAGSDVFPDNGPGRPGG